MQEEKLELATEWDKVFPKSEHVDHGKVTFASHCDLYDDGGKSAIPWDTIEAFFGKHLQAGGR